MNRPTLAAPYRVEDGQRFGLDRHDPGDLQDFQPRKGEAAELLAEELDRLGGLQKRLYAEDRRSLLLIFQSMDAGGKDGTIRHVMAGINPQGLAVHSFKSPSAEELAHDFLWRAVCRLPRRGRIGIFNRSYYEEVLITRLHPEMLEREKLPHRGVTEDLWAERFESIVALERHLGRNGTRILKFFLNISPEEQRRRFLSRLRKPEKTWKFANSDLAERRRWDDYAAAYQAAIRATATADAPWYIVPANHKWFAHLVVAAAIVEALEALGLSYPEIDETRRRELDDAHAELAGGPPDESGAAHSREPDPANETDRRGRR